MKVSEYRKIDQVYSISDDGRIWNKRLGRHLRISTAAGGYRVVRINNKIRTVHRLVATAYLGTPKEPDMVVSHIDNIKTNNHYTNLEWVTNFENVSKAHREGLNPGRKLTLEDARSIRKLSARHGYDYLKNRYGISQNHLFRILNNRCWTE